MSAIETERLTKSYGRHRGIEGLTMTVEEGEVFGFLGPNGAGKTWPLALLAARLAVVATGWSLRTTVVTGSIAGVLVGMYVLDLVGRLDERLDGIRYASVFRYYGKAIQEGIDPVAFVGVTAVAVAFAAVGALLFERRDLAG